MLNELIMYTTYIVSFILHVEAFFPHKIYFFTDSERTFIYNIDL